MDLATGLMLTFANIGFGGAVLTGWAVWLAKTGLQADPEAVLDAATTVDIGSLGSELAAVKEELETVKFLLLIAIVAVAFLLFKNYF